MILDDPRWPVTLYVYAYVSPEGEVLYVGQTADPRTRRSSHRQSWWWAPEWEWSLICTATTRAEALAAEREAIRELAPLYNVHHNRRQVA